MQGWGENPQTGMFYQRLILFVLFIILCNVLLAYFQIQQAGNLTARLFKATGQSLLTPAWFDLLSYRLSTMCLRSGKSVPPK